MEISIPTFTVEWYWIVIVLLYLCVGAAVAFTSFMGAEFSAGIGRAFGYPTAVWTWVELVLIVILWPAVVGWTIVCLLLSRGD